jgi:transcriptional regulator with XRE-family HTH domain
MGRRARLRPKRLPEKLLQIRNAFGISQTEMLKRLGFEGVIIYNRISEYELGKNEPPLPILLEYARVAGIHVEDLINDKTNLPAKLPGKVKHTT